MGQTFQAKPCNKMRGPNLVQQILHDMLACIGESKVRALEAIGQSLVIEAEMKVLCSDMSQGNGVKTEAYPVETHRFSFSQKNRSQTPQISSTQVFENSETSIIRCSLREASAANTMLCVRRD